LLSQVIIIINRARGGTAQHMGCFMKRRTWMTMVQAFF
jgi:hypothetical protein